MLRHGAPTVVDDRHKAEQEGGQGAAAAQELQPPVAGELLALQGAAPEGGAGQHGAEQRRVIGVQQSVQGQAAAADDEDSGCRVQRRSHAVVELRAGRGQGVSCGRGG